MITSEQLASSGTEDGHQRALLHQCALHIAQYPELRWLYHIPNGGERGIGSKASLNGGLMKALGTKKGVCDLHLPVPRGNYACLYIEMKKPNSGKLSDEQHLFIDFAVRQHALVAVCDNWSMAWYVLTVYLTCPATLAGELKQKGLYDPKNYFDPAKVARLLEKG